MGFGKISNFFLITSDFSRSYFQVATYFLPIDIIPYTTPVANINPLPKKEVAPIQSKKGGIAILESVMKLINHHSKQIRLYKQYSGQILTDCQRFNSTIIYLHGRLFIL